MGGGTGKELQPVLAYPGLRRLHRRGTVRRAGVAVPSTCGGPSLTDGGGDRGGTWKELQPVLAHPGLRRLHRRGAVRRAGVAVPSTCGGPSLTDGGIRVGRGRRCNECEIIEVKVKIMAPGDGKSAKEKGENVSRK